MAITFHGDAHIPADNGAQAGPTVALDKDTAPLSDAAVGSLIVVQCNYRVTQDASVGNIRYNETGGQCWNNVKQGNTTNVTQSWFWCTFNGTWTADPSFSVYSGSSISGTATMSVHVLVFAPTTSTKHWVVDFNGGPRTATFTASGTTKTITAGYTPTTASNVTLASWNTTGVITYSSLSGTGWTQSGIDATQFRNTSGTDHVQTFAYLIQTSAANIPDVSQVQTVGTAGSSSIITFAEIDLVTGDDTGAAAYINQTSNSEGDNPGGTFGNINSAVPSGVTAGDGIVGYAYFECYADQWVLSITDDAGNNYQIVAQVCNYNYAQTAIVFYCPKLTGSPTLVTVTMQDGNAGYWGCALHGVEHLGKFDKAQVVDHPAIDGGSTENVVTPAFTPSADGCFLFGGANLVAAATSNVFTWNSPFTERNEFGDNTSDPTGSTGSTVQSTAASVDGDVTLNAGADMIMIAAAFTAASGTPPPTASHLLGYRLF